MDLENDLGYTLAFLSSTAVNRLCAMFMYRLPNLRNASNIRWYLGQLSLSIPTTQCLFPFTEARTEIYVLSVAFEILVQALCQKSGDLD